MLFDLPFLYEDDYLSFLNSKDDVYSVYFSTATELPGDARVASFDISVDTQVEYLKAVPNVKKYLTLNGRYTPLYFYHKDQLKVISDGLEQLKNNNVLDGVIFLDFYLVTMLKEYAPSLVSELEFIPSINCHIDTPDKWEMMQIYLNETKEPSKIILDRSLNRNIVRLREMSDYLRKIYPDLKLEMLVNEGCLYHCPFKVNHDILISLANDNKLSGQVYLKDNAKGINIHNINEQHGCSSYLKNKPEDLLKIPFVRPEDVVHIENYVDIIKISGKILGYDFVLNCYDAYKERCWEGNLLDLLDAAGSVRKDFYIFNDTVPKKFYQKLSTCGSQCQICTYCPDVMPKFVQKLGEE